MFEKGTYVVKAGEGVCLIDGRVEMTVPGERRATPYYQMIPVSDPKIRVYLPEAGEHPDVRPVMGTSEAESLLSRIREIEMLPVADEKAREQVYRDAVRSCDPELLVSMLKTLFFRGKERTAQGKRITAMDERYLAMAERALYSEICFVLPLKEAEVRALITGQKN